MAKKIYRNKEVEQEPFAPLMSMDDVEDGTTYGRVRKEFIDKDGNIKGKTILLTEVDGTLDDIINGANFGKVALTAISAGKILLTGGGGVVGSLPVGNTDAQCTNALADQTSANGQDYSWVTGTKPPTNADNTASNSQNVAWLTDAGAMSYEDMVEYSKLGTTIIVGGYIKTSLLTADNIVTGILTGVVVRTAASGKRVVLQSNQLRSYDSSNNLRWHTDGEYTKWLDNNEVEMARSYGWKTGDSYVYTINVGTGTANVGTLSLYGGPNSKNMTLNCPLSMGSNKITSLATPTASTDAATKAYVDSAGGFSCSDLSACNITHFGNPVYAYSIRAQSGGNYDLGSASYAWNTLHLKNNSSIYWNNTYYFRHNGSTFILNDELNMNSNRILGVQDPILSTDAANMNYVDNNAANKTLSNLSTTTAINQHLQPGVANSKYCGTSGKYWHRVYSDSYWTKNTTFQTFDKYDDLQIIRDLKFRNNKLVLGNLPKEIHDKDFINFGGMTSFNLCVNKKIVETIDDLDNRLKKLEK